MLLARCLSFVALAAFLFSLAAPPASAQRPKEKQRGKNDQPDNIKQPQRGQLPTDDKLLELYMNFVRDAEKVAAEYERQRKTEEARAVYEEILKFVPQYKKAQAKLKEYQEKEASAEKKTVEVDARQDWQDTGVWVLAGKPITITAHGTWSVKAKFDFEGTADGMELPAALRGTNIGALMGSIVAPPPKSKEGEKSKPLRPDAGAFLVGASKQFVPSESGRLMLRINDTDLSDNSGRLRVDIVGTFQRR